MKREFYKKYRIETTERSFGMTVSIYRKSGTKRIFYKICGKIRDSDAIRIAKEHIDSLPLI